jgi:hypothetical protein
MLTEEDVEAGRLKDYKVLYVTDPCITSKAAVEIGNWVREGGFIFGSCAAGTRNEFNEPSEGLSAVFGIQPEIQTKVQPGDYRTRGKLNPLPYVDTLKVGKVGAIGTDASFGIIGTTSALKPTNGKVVGKFKDNTPAAVFHEYGKGKALVVAACPGLSYLKDAKFVPLELKEKYPPTQRRFINSWAVAAKASRLVELSHPVVEAGVFDAPKGSALVLANFTYQPIGELNISLPVRKEVITVRSLTKGECAFTTEVAPEQFAADGFSHLIKFNLNLGLNDIVILE